LRASLLQPCAGERVRRGRLGFIGSTEFRERSAAAGAGRWIQIGARFEKSLDGAGRGTGDVTSGSSARPAKDTPVFAHVTVLLRLVASRIRSRVPVDARSAY
jgi:hypothetical protein